MGMILTFVIVIVGRLTPTNVVDGIVVAPSSKVAQGSVLLPPVAAAAVGLYRRRPSTLLLLATATGRRRWGRGYRRSLPQRRSGSSRPSLNLVAVIVRLCG